jgi:hypothetical protein
VPRGRHPEVDKNVALLWLWTIYVGARRRRLLVADEKLELFITCSIFLSGVTLAPIEPVHSEVLQHDDSIGDACRG